MKSTKSVKIYVVDNDVMFLDEFKENFTFEHSYTLYTFFSVEEFINHLKKHDDKSFTIAIINDLVKSHGLNTKSVVEILPMIKNIDKYISVIILTDNDNLEIRLTSSGMRPSAFITKDWGLYLKLEPTLNRIISKYQLHKSNIICKTTIAIAIPVIIIIIILFVLASFLI